MSLRGTLVLALMVALIVPAGVFAAQSVERQNGDVRQISMYSTSLVNPRGSSRARDLGPRPPTGRVFNPNDPRWKNKPAELLAMQSSIDALLSALRSGSDPSAAWSNVPGNVKTMLKDGLGIDEGNWQAALPNVRSLARREPVKVIDPTRLGEGGLVYQTQTRMVSQTYSWEQPVWAPVGCGCRGWQVVGYSTQYGTRQVPTQVSVPVAMLTPVSTTDVIMTPGTHDKQVPRQVTETYFVSQPVWGPVGCGCRGSQIVGYQNVPQTRQVTVYDTVRVAAFEDHVPQEFKKPGVPLNGVLANYFSNEEEHKAGFTEVKPGLVSRPTLNDSGATAPTLDAKGKGSDFASARGNDEIGKEPINNHTRGNSGPAHP